MRFLLLIAFTSIVVLGAPASMDTQPIRIDVNHSNIGFAVPIAGGLSEVYGKFSKFEMSLQYDAKEVTNSSVEVKIQADSIDTGIDQRDAHLRTADFFDVENHPQIVFRSKKVSSQEGRHFLTGDLTMRGVTKEISFPFSITGEDVDQKNGTFTTGFVGELTLNRRDFGVNYTHGSSPGFIGDEVRIRLNIMTRSSKVVAE